MLDIQNYFSNFSSELATFLIATLPIAELRISIPVALKVYHLSVSNAFILSVLGNIFPLIFVLLFLEPVSKFLSEHSTIFERFFTWLFERTRRKTTKKVERYKEWALVLFVAIPLPMTGGWTGACAAFIFGIPFKKSFPLILLGVLIAGVIVTITTLGASSIFSL